MTKDPLGVTGIIHKVDGLIKVLTDESLAEGYGADKMDLSYDAMMQFVALKLTSTRDVLIRCEEALSRIGTLDFSTPIEVDDTEHAGNYFAHSLNVLMEELSEKIFPFHNEIINTLSDIIIVTDPRGHIQKANRSFYQVSGLEETEIKGKKFSELLNDGKVNVDLDRGLSLESINVDLLGKDKIIPLTVTISEVKGIKNFKKGHIIIARPV